jgi:hypothetical protein
MKIRFIITSLVLTLLLFGILETASRAPFVKRHLPMPSRGINHQFLDLYFALIHELKQAKGGIDAVMIGTSQVAVSFNPEYFSPRYREHTGSDITAFNFGIAGLTLKAEIELMHILIEDYQPEWVLIGLSVPMLSEETRAAEERILTSPWVQYRNNDINFSGFLTEHSCFFRYFLRFRQWLQYPEFSSRISRKESQVSPYGFSNFKNPSSTKGLVLDPNRVQRFRNNLSEYSISKSRVEELDRILAFRDRTNLIVIEMPVHPYFKTFYRNGEMDHKQTVNVIRNRCLHHSVPFIPDANPTFDSDRIWSQTNHMNALGAEIFSLWLADKLAEAGQ